MDMDIKTVTVIGANGIMGTNAAGIFASFGNAKVYMISRSIEKSEVAAVKAAKSVRAESILKNLIPKDYSSLEQCVRESDLVFESVSENMEVKKEVMQRIKGALNNTTIVASGTSGLSITAIAECLQESNRKNCFGIHFFNPPYNLVLCEVIPTKYSDSSTLQEIKCYLKDVLYRAVVEVKDSPAFLGNRIGFQFINEVLQYAEKYKERGGIDYIDSILGTYTGRNMAPLVTADFVGLDVHKAIVDNIFQNTNDFAHNTFELPEYARMLIEKGNLGRKTQAGLYKIDILENGIKRVKVYDITTKKYRDEIKYQFDYIKKMNLSLKNGDYQGAIKELLRGKSEENQICLEMLLKYVLYSLYISNNVSNSVHSADTAMATGFNWCPPLALIELLNSVTDFKSLVNTYLDSKLLNEVNATELIALAEPSRYDYRRFFKAGK